MNRSNWDTPAGRPRDINDPFTWAQEGIEEAFSGIFSFLGNTAPEGVILSGCIVSIPAAATPGNADSADISAGFIYLDGEVLRVPAATTLTKGSGDDWVFDLDDTGNGVPLAYAGGSEEIMRVRIGVLRGEPNATSANYMPLAAPQWGMAVKGAIVPYTGTFTATVGTFVITGSHGCGYQFSRTNMELVFYFDIPNFTTSDSTPTLQLQLPTIGGAQLYCRQAVAIRIGRGVEDLVLRSNLNSSTMLITRTDTTNIPANTYPNQYTGQLTIPVRF